jgi:hypothetical protein
MQRNPYLGPLNGPRFFYATEFPSLCFQSPPEKKRRLWVKVRGADGETQARQRLAGRSVCSWRLSIISDHFMYLSRSPSRSSRSARTAWIDDLAACRRSGPHGGGLAKRRFIRKPFQLPTAPSVH